MIKTKTREHRVIAKVEPPAPCHLTQGDPTGMAIWQQESSSTAPFLSMWGTPGPELNRGPNPSVAG